MKILSRKSMSKTIVVGGTGFIGRNFIKFLEENGRSCISIGRSSGRKLNCQQISLSDFSGYQSTEFLALNIGDIVYALGDPNMNSKSNSEGEILGNFLAKLEEFNFKGRFLLISSNAANPDSGYTTIKYNSTLRNDYIIRKQLLESIVLSSKLDSVVLRAPAVIGIDMNDSSHIKRILGNSLLARIMSLSIFRGSIEVLSINDLSKEILGALESKESRSVIEPCAPAYRWFRMSRFLSRSQDLTIEDINVLSRIEQGISRVLPTSVRFLVFPHWVTKYGDGYFSITERHLNVVNTLQQIRLGRTNLGKSLLVTGTASGLGAEISEVLLNRNYQVFGIDIIEPQQSDSVQKFLERDNFQYVQGDLNSNDFQNYLSSIIEMNNISGIFSVAGIGPRLSTEEISDVELKRIFNVNFFAPIGLASNLRRTKQAGSFFVYVGSSSGIEGLPKFSAYSASKAALHTYFFSMLCELKENDMRVFGIIPSGMRTNFQKVNNVPVSSLDKILLKNPRKIAVSLVKWSEGNNKKSSVKYSGISARLFLVLRNLPLFAKIRLIKSLAEKAR